MYVVAPDVLEALSGLSSPCLPPNTEMAGSASRVACSGDSCSSGVCGQEAASVAEADEASLANTVSGTAPDSEPDEPKDAEAEETVSHGWSAHAPKFIFQFTQVLFSLCQCCNIISVGFFFVQLPPLWDKYTYSIIKNLVFFYFVGEKKSSKHKKKKQKKEKEDKEKKKKKKHHHHRHHSDGGAEQSVQNGTVEEEEPLPVSWNVWLAAYASAHVSFITLRTTARSDTGSPLFQPMSNYKLLAENSYIKMVSVAGTAPHPTSVCVEIGVSLFELFDHLGICCRDGLVYFTRLSRFTRV